MSRSRLRPCHTSRRADDRPRLALVVLSGLLELCAGTGRADERFPNQAAESSLPRGAGLAAAYRGDVGLAADPRVLFSDDFETGNFEKWEEVRNERQAVLSFVDESARDTRFGRKSLRVTATLGQNTGGGLTRWYEPCDPVFIRFYTRFAPDCDYVHHFVTLRANKGLRGGDRWSGFGGAGLRPRGDERFSTALEPTGDWGRLPPPGQWNFYTYWHEMQPSPDRKFWGNALILEPRHPIPRDRWICCEFMLKHNTPGQPDGEQACWIDGELRGHWRGINWRTSPTLWANALTLESYVTDRWTKHRVNVVDFDNVVIAREYIGPTP